MRIPTINQYIKYNADVAFALNLQYINAEHVNIPKIGKSGQNGTLNGRSLFGSVFLRIKTARHITINDVKVPKLHSSAEIFKSINKPHKITISPDTQVIMCGVLNFLCIEFHDLGKKWSLLIAYKIRVVPN